MVTRSPIRLVVNLTYLTLLFGVMLWVYVSLTRFEGWLRLEAGASEHVVYLPSEASPSGLLSRQALPAELLPFDLPSSNRHLPSEATYVARALPFSVALLAEQGASPSTWRDELLNLASGKSFSLQAGQTIDAPEGSLKVVGMGPWLGLAPSPRGTRSAALMLATAQDPIGQTLLVEAGRWALVDEKLALSLTWHASEEEAQAAAQTQTRPGLESAWWTVRDGAGIVRSSSFAPGSGMECSDGSVWTVERLQLDVATGEAVLHLLVEEAGKRQPVQVRANADAGESRARFHHPGAASQVVVLHAWREEQAIAAQLVPGESKAAIKSIASGGQLVLPEGRSLWLAQLLPYAVPVDADSTSLQQVVIEDKGETRHYLREGGKAVARGAEWSYRREETRPPRTLTLRFITPDEATAPTVSLAPGDSVRHGSWRFEQATSPWSQRDTRGVYLRASFDAFSPDRLAGMSLFMAAAYGLVLARFWPRRRWQPAASGERLSE